MKLRLTSADQSISVGSPQRPGYFEISDARLQVVSYGTTPAVVELPPGLYEVIVRNDYAVERQLVRLRPGEGIFDATNLGPLIATRVPVSCARDRRQEEAEEVLRLSARLRDGRALAGLIAVPLTV